MQFVSAIGLKKKWRQLLDQSDANAKTNRGLAKCVSGHVHLPRGLFFNQPEVEEKPRQSWLANAGFPALGTGNTTSSYYIEFWLVYSISYACCDLPDLICYF